MHVDNYSRTKLPDSGRALDFSEYWKCETRFFCVRNRPLMRFSLLLLALCFFACESTDNTPIDPFQLPPFVTSLAVLPTSINTDTVNIGPQRLPTDSLRITVTATVQASDPEGLPNVKEVTARVFKPASQDLIQTAQLYDKGNPPDALAGDGTFSGAVQFVIVRSDIGDFKIEVTATNKADVTSNTLTASFSVLRLNKPPAISDVVAPDTVSVGTSTILLILAVRATDPDGQTDIQKVFLNSFKPDGSPASGNPFQMFDDGNASGSSGDAIEGDGIYSLIIQLPPGTAKGNYRFEFQAVDRSGAASNIIAHTLTVR
jgi:hypothetical protein